MLISYQLVKRNLHDQIICIRILLAFLENRELEEESILNYAIEMEPESIAEQVDEEASAEKQGNKEF